MGKTNRLIMKKIILAMVLCLVSCSISAQQDVIIDKKLGFAAVINENGAVTRAIPLQRVCELSRKDLLEQLLGEELVEI